ncbi:MAG: hydroxymethylbilane synthase [Phycisphaerales bacterium]|nr:hydroxymethylbilane synthase [Phycisphaerales bacterium]
MTTVRVGTRGSELAISQSRWVCDLLSRAQPTWRCEVVSIATHGDLSPHQPMDALFPPDAFVGAIERALLDGRIDLAVHSYKDLPSKPTAGLTIAAVPPRAAPHDVLVTHRAVAIDELPNEFRIGTSSPRRRAQFRRHAPVEIVPIRGNVPTRLARVRAGDLDGVVLAAAGLARLQLRPRHMIHLPVDRFTPAPAQGALAVQTRAGDAFTDAVAAINDEPSRLAVDAERAFLGAAAVGCQSPVGALATVDGASIELSGQLFSDDGRRVVDGIERGVDPVDIGRRLAVRLCIALDQTP